MRAAMMCQFISPPLCLWQALAAGCDICDSPGPLLLAYNPHSYLISTDADEHRSLKGPKKIFTAQLQALADWLRYFQGKKQRFQLRTYLGNQVIWNL